MQYKIGIGVTVKDRFESSEECIKNIKKLSKDCKLVVVDDGSSSPFRLSDFRFEKSVGIAVAKNKCFELLDDCDYIFLFDNDCWPIHEDWYERYIEAYKKTGCEHFSFTLSNLSDGRPNGNKQAEDHGEIISYRNACGCALFFTRRCLDVAGGFDPVYGQYGYDHTDMSTRINNLGLTPYRFCDVPNSLELFYSQDYYREVSTTVKAKQARLSINAKIYAQNIRSKKYIPYKKPKTAIITTYFTTVKDPQREDNWEVDHNKLEKLIKSMKGQKLVILNDCFDKESTDQIEYVKVNPTCNPYFQRWISLYEYLTANKYDAVFMVDGTDVVMLNNPFNTDLGDYLYTGDEKQVVGCKWIRDNHNDDIEDGGYQLFYLMYKNRTLLNAGIIGGKSKIVESFAKLMKEWYEGWIEKELYTDMPIFNYIAYTQFDKQVRHGSKVNTEFKKNDTRNLTPWFRHK